MKRLSKLIPILAITSVVVLSSCGGQTQPPDQIQQKQPEPIAKPARVVPASLSDSQNMLTIRPGGIDRCTDQDGVISVEVEWNASSVGTEGVHIYLQNPNEEAKLWSSAGAVSKGNTGEWLRDGSTVRLVNADGNQDLASITLKDVPCE